MTATGDTGIGGGAGGIGGKIASDRESQDLGYPGYPGDPGDPGAGTTVTFSGGVTEAQNGIFTEGALNVGENMAVTGEFNKAKYIKIAEKVPICTGGAIAKEGGKWVVTPNENAAAVTIEGLPAGESVEGIRIGDYIVPSAAFHGSTEGGTTYILLALKEDGVVTIDGEKIPVRVTIGEGVEAGEAFVVSGGRVTAKVKAIPGLKYTLWRTGALAAPAAEAATVRSGETTVTLTDGEPPKGQAFYKVVVSVP